VIDAERLAAALAETREALDAAAARSGRSPGAVELVLAGKYIPADEAEAIVRAGAPVVGENRLQDLLAKRAAVGDRLTFDFIGHLQRRKVPAALAEARLIHAVDSERLAAEIDARAERETRVLLQVNLSGEPTKYGIFPHQIEAFVDAISRFPNLVAGGLMALPPADPDPETSRPYFARLRTLRDELAVRWSGRHDFRDLSMGTSQDFVVAAEEGATIVRIGRSLIDRSQVS
jgi:pyridoxal phosphate enzyme (YggS family)